MNRSIGDPTIHQAAALLPTLPGAARRRRPGRLGAGAAAPAPAAAATPVRCRCLPRRHKQASPAQAAALRQHPGAAPYPSYHQQASPAAHRSMKGMPSSSSSRVPCMPPSPPSLNRLARWCPVVLARVVLVVPKQRAAHIHAHRRAAAPAAARRRGLRRAAGSGGGSGQARVAACGGKAGAVQELGEAGRWAGGRCGRRCRVRGAAVGGWCLQRCRKALRRLHEHHCRSGFTGQLRTAGGAPPRAPPQLSPTLALLRFIFWRD